MKIKDDFIFDNNTHQIIKGSNQLFKGNLFILKFYEEEIGDIIVDLSKSDKEIILFSLYFLIRL